MYNEIKKILNSSDYEFNCENPEYKRSKDFNKMYLREIKKIIKPYGFTIISDGDGFCECSGFIKNERDKYVYFNSGDYRLHNEYNNIFDHVLIRTANNEYDYRGGENNYCALKDIGKKAQELFERKR